MKKVIIILVAFAGLTVNALAFEIGSFLGLSTGNLTSSELLDASLAVAEAANNGSTPGEKAIEDTKYVMPNFAFMIPHSYGEKNWGGRFEAGFVDAHVVTNYFVTYSWTFDSLKISPFAGCGLILPLGFAKSAGCSVRYKFKIGDVYADLRLSHGGGLASKTTGISFNTGYISRFGKDR